MSFSIAHPERADDEVWVTNADQRNFPLLDWKTKRAGKCAYTPDGTLITDTAWPGAFPVFVKQEEILKKGFNLKRFLS